MSIALESKYRCDYSEEAENAWIALDKEFGFIEQKFTDAQLEAYDSKIDAVCDSFESKFDALGKLGAIEHDLICNIESVCENNISSSYYDVYDFIWYSFIFIDSIFVLHLIFPWIKEKYVLLKIKYASGDLFTNTTETADHKK